MQAGVEVRSEGVSAQSKFDLKNLQAIPQYNNSLQLPQRICIEFKLGGDRECHPNEAHY